MKSTATSTAPPGEEGVATFDDARAEALRYTGHGYTRVRHLLVQRARGEDRPSTLGMMVNSRKHRALLLYLMLLTVWPFLMDRKQPFEGALWARLLSTETGGMPWTTSDISKAWGELDKLSLISRVREARLLRVVPRREDAGAEYTIPDGGVDTSGYDQRYLVLPGAFWTDRHFANLTLPALATLLIILKETSIKKPEVWLPLDRAQEWYGLSPASLDKGLRELQAGGLVHRRSQRIKAPLSPTGYTVHCWYSLLGEFSPTSRSEAQRRARSARAARRRGIALGASKKGGELS